MRKRFATLVLALVTAAAVHAADPPAEAEPVRVFIFAGQSNMAGSDSKAPDIRKFPPFAGLDRPQEEVLFSYVLGREEKKESGGWVALQPVDEVVGPELSFARRVTRETGARVAIIKCAAGGTTLGADWNPDEPGGFKLYPLALQLVRSSLAELDRRRLPYRIEGFMWHQGENDMFDEKFRGAYGANLQRFLACWRRDLGVPGLRCYLGELCTKTIWGMDNRENMYAIRKGQMSVVASDPLSTYVPTSHDAVEIGGGAGLHYHYGTLGQLEHGVNHADAYLQSIGKPVTTSRPLKSWPYDAGSKVKLFVLSGFRNMEGERAFREDLRALPGGAELLRENHTIAYRYSIGAGHRVSHGWEPLAPAGCYDTFGPELSFGAALRSRVAGNIAIAKFTDSGSQMNDWTPEGTTAAERHVYPKFIAFIRTAIDDLKAKGHAVELAGIFHHAGENDMSFGPYRRKAAAWLRQTVQKSRADLGLPNLPWIVSQQPPAESDGLDRIDVTADIAALAAADPAFIHVRAFSLPPQDEKLVITAAGIRELGALLAHSFPGR
jgi:hypothetical protein